MTRRRPTSTHLRLPWIGRILVALLLWTALLPPMMPAGPVSEAEALMASALCGSGADRHGTDPATPAHAASHCAGCPPGLQAGLPPIPPDWALPVPGPTATPPAPRRTDGPAAAGWLRLPARAPPTLA